MRRRLLDFLRVPHDPTAPAGDDDVRVFRAAPGYFLYRFTEWLLKNAAAGVGLFFALRFAAMAHNIIPASFPLGGWTVTEGFLLRTIGVIELVSVLSYVTQAAVGLILLRLDYENRWYIVSNRSLRIREGLTTLREQTMTFANVQHVGIRRGPLQQLLGIADVEVRTAGGGGDSEDGTSKEGTHVAYFKGIANAELVRDVIRERLRQHRDAGLGDPDDVVHSPPLLSSDLLEAALAVAEEARALRQTVSTAT